MSNYAEGVLAIIIFFVGFVFFPLSFTFPYPMNLVVFLCGILVATLGILLPFTLLREFENRKRRTPRP
jgi:pilus assembly protein TadC